MTTFARVATDGSIVVLLLAGVALFRSPRTARLGNGAAAAALAAAMLLVLLRNPVNAWTWLVIALVTGSGLGLVAAYRVNMLQVPAMVAFQHGVGGLAAMLIAFVELWRGGQTGMTALGQMSGILGLGIGSATFSASLIASGKLIGWLRPTPTLLPKHGRVFRALVAAGVGFGVLACWADGIGSVAAMLGLVIVCVLLGVVAAIRIGGADMPVLISFLNATAGFAAAFCGVVLRSHLLVACGAVVAASGSILTHVMCRAMNRRLWQVFLGFQAHPDVTQSSPVPAGSPVPIPAAARAEAGREPQAAALFRLARKVIMVPGYGMAVSQAQAEVAELAGWLQRRGATVLYAIHPVAGRMPGHMNVLLAEADVDYDLLKEMDEINPQFRECDVALVVGACDVVNPAAKSVPNTPISGMPILRADEAARVVVCNLDERPGYSGVPNPLYRDAKTLFLNGDAKASLRRIIVSLSAEHESQPAGG